MKVGDYKGRKVAEPDFCKIFFIWRYCAKGLQISPKSVMLGWLVGNAVFSETGLTIFLIFCRMIGNIKAERS